MGILFARQNRRAYFLSFFKIIIPKCPLPVGTSEGMFLRQIVFSKKFFAFFLKNRVRFGFSIPNK